MQALWMIASSFLFASMGVCVKFASEYFNSAELVFYRGALGMVFMAVYARARGTPLATRYPAMPGAARWAWWRCRRGFTPSRICHWLPR